MKLARVGEPGRERPALVAGDQLFDLSGLVDDIGPATLARIASGDFVVPDVADLRLLEGGQRLGPCVAGVGKIICVGLNYVDHAIESGFAPPTEPIVFMKATTSLSGPNDPIQVPPRATKVDYEIELGVVIGARASDISEAEADGVVAGYCVFNDVSERAFQLERGGQWVKGKSLDTFGPCGPWLVTKDEIADPGNLALRLRVNGEMRQAATTADMIFPVPRLVSYLSQFMTLMPGDVIATGTPPGVALGMAEPRYLRHGDVVELEIDGLGMQRQTIQAIGS